MESATVPKVVVIASLLAVAAVGWVLTGDRMDGMDHGPGTELGGLDWFHGQLGGDDGRHDAPVARCWALFAALLALGVMSIA
jgi:hypothetical protein